MISLTKDITTALKQAGDLPVSMKAVVLCHSHALVLLQPDGIWELAGGRLEAGEDAYSCLIREVEEETGLDITVDRVLNTWIREKGDGSLRFVITVLAYSQKEPDLAHVQLSKEHVGARFIRLGDQPPAPMLDGYLQDLRLANLHHNEAGLD